MTGEWWSQTQQRSCGRPTRNGGPCQAILHPGGSSPWIIGAPDPACPTHLTAAERRERDAYRAAWDAAHRAGQAAARWEERGALTEVAKLLDGPAPTLAKVARVLAAAGIPVRCTAGTRTASTTPRSSDAPDR
jgi:hypothetical protein